MTMIPALLFQNDPSAALAGGLLAVGGAMMFVMFAIMVLFIIGCWRVFAKAGQPGWAI